MTSRMDVDEGQSITSRGANPTLDELMHFVDYLIKKDITFYQEADSSRLSSLKRWFEEGKIEGTVTTGEHVKRILGHYRFAEEAFSNGQPVNKNKTLKEKIDNVKAKGKEIEPAEYYNTLSSITVYAMLLHGI